MNRQKIWDAAQAILKENKPCDKTCKMHDCCIGCMYLKEGPCGVQCLGCRVYLCKPAFEHLPRKAKISWLWLNVKAHFTETRYRIPDGCKYE